VKPIWSKKPREDIRYDENISFGNRSHDTETAREATIDPVGHSESKDLMRWFEVDANGFLNERSQDENAAHRVGAS